MDPYCGATRPYYKSCKSRRILCCPARQWRVFLLRVIGIFIGINLYSSIPGKSNLRNSNFDGMTCNFGGFAIVMPYSHNRIHAVVIVLPFSFASWTALRKVLCNLLLCLSGLCLAVLSHVTVLTWAAWKCSLSIHTRVLHSCHVVHIRLLVGWLVSNTVFVTKGTYVWHQFFGVHIILSCTYLVHFFWHSWRRVPGSH
jgi:hypothetical protein